MSLHTESLVPCERIIQDANTLAVTLVSCIEQLAAPTLPSTHPGFGLAARLAWTGTPPTTDLSGEFRIVRYSDTDPESTVHAGPFQWAAHTLRGRVLCNFALIRLWREEVVYFRIDLRIGTGRWRKGSACSLLVRKLEVTDEQRTMLNEDMQRLMTPPSTPG